MDHEAIKHLQLKTFTAYSAFGDKEVTHKDFIKDAQDSFEVLHELTTFVCRATSK